MNVKEVLQEMKDDSNRLERLVTKAKMLNVKHSLQKMKDMEQELNNFTKDYIEQKKIHPCGYSMLPIHAWKYKL